VLEARGVHKAYGRHQVLRGANLAVKSGQLTAVVGENGSGKSTLLKIPAGALAADRGNVWLTGTIGYCPQDLVLNENLTVDQHLRYFAAAYRLPTLQRGGTLVDMLGFGQLRRHVVGALSGGTRQKLNLTLALLHDPDVLLLDEPYQGFDWETEHSGTQPSGATSHSGSPGPPRSPSPASSSSRSAPAPAGITDSVGRRDEGDLSSYPGVLLRDHAQRARRDPPRTRHRPGASSVS